MNSLQRFWVAVFGACGAEHSTIVSAIVLAKIILLAK
ncbi:hypothetical protein GGD57_002031 [Rhizobium esperanzae]|uniref:Uncharacterized protein n=1 Tax=Rhizobium esperanzae TaxID=1967781 RepID=A0A7W6R2W0_9HYPH|nr:hypothetical protein [Rhizobium esperanzae]